MTVERSPRTTPAPAPYAPGAGPPQPHAYVPERRIVLVDLLDRLLAGGVVVSGDLTLSIADVDLVTISLRVLISSVSGQDVLDPYPHDRTGT